MLLLVFLLVILLAFERDLLSHVEGGEQFAHGARKAVLILEIAQQRIQILARALLDVGTPEIDDLLRGPRRSAPGQALATINEIASSIGASARSVISSYLPPRW